MAAFGREVAAFGQGIGQQLVVAGKAVVQAEAEIELRQPLGLLGFQVLLEPRPQLAVDFLVGQGAAGRLPRAQAASLDDFGAENAPPQVGGKRDDAVDRARPGQFMDQRAEAPDGNAHEPDRLVALGPLRFDDVRMQALAERLVVVVGNVGIHQQRIGRQVALADGADEAFALEFVGFQIGARQEDQERLGPFIVFG